MTNDNAPVAVAAVPAVSTPEQAIETLDKMIGQLEIMMDHFREQTNISTDTKTKTLADMGEQLAAMKMGKAALTTVEGIRESVAMCTNMEDTYCQISKLFQ